MPHSVPLGGDIDVFLYDDEGIEVRRSHVAAGHAYRLSAEDNLRYDHVIHARGNVLVLNLCRVRMLGAQDGEWTVPACRLRI